MTNTPNFSTYTALELKATALWNLLCVLAQQCAARFEEVMPMWLVSDFLEPNTPNAYEFLLACEQHRLIERAWCSREVNGGEWQGIRMKPQTPVAKPKPDPQHFCSMCDTPVGVGREGDQLTDAWSDHALTEHHRSRVRAARPFQERQPAKPVFFGDLAQQARIYGNRIVEKPIPTVTTRRPDETCTSTYDVIAERVRGGEDKHLWVSRCCHGTTSQGEDYTSAVKAALEACALAHEQLPPIVWVPPHCTHTIPVDDKGRYLRSCTECRLDPKLTEAFNNMPPGPIMSDATLKNEDGGFTVDLEGTISFIACTPMATKAILAQVEARQDQLARVVNDLALLDALGITEDVGLTIGETIDLSVEGRRIRTYYALRTETLVDKVVEP